MIRRIYLLVLSLSFGFSTIMMYSVVNVKVVTTNAEVDAVNVKVIIDCGHGGEDGGAVSQNGTVEKDINLAIGLTLKRMFIQGGFEVQMIRETDKAIYDDSAVTLKEKKVSDIHNRTEICNSSPDNIYISIHQNKFEQSKYRGTQVFYASKSNLSKELAESISISVKGLLQNDNQRQCKEGTKDIYILSNATVPAVLVECGFLSNPEEEKLLNTDIYRNKLSFAIYCGFLEYYNQYYR